MAAPDLASFRACFPAFAAATDAIVTCRLDDAVATLPTGTWGTGDRYIRGVHYLTAHLLTLEPEGRAMRLDAKAIAAAGGGTYAGSEYGQVFDKLRRGVGPAMRVI